MSSVDPSITAEQEPIIVACAADENYAMGLAVTIRSMLDHYRGERHINLTVLDGGMSQSTRERLCSSWEHPRLTIDFLAPDDAGLRDLHCMTYMPPAVYFRLLLPDLLPKEDRILYLDSDLIIERDITELWEADLEGNPLGAVLDADIETVSHPTKGLPNFCDLGLKPDTPYCNTGVLVIDADQWRRHSIGQRIIDYIRENGTIIQFWDQDAVNAVLSEQWKELPPEWNVTAEGLIARGGWIPSSARKAGSLNAAMNAPHVIHFVFQKPWDSVCIHTKRDLFFTYLDRTVWKGWRTKTHMPSSPAQTAIGYVPPLLSCAKDPSVSGNSSFDRPYARFCLLSLSPFGCMDIAAVLNQHPDILVHDNIFSPPCHNLTAWKNRLNRSPHPGENPDAFLEEQVFPANVSSLLAVGFQLIPYHCDQHPNGRLIWQYLLDRNMHMIFVRLKNPLDRCLLEERETVRHKAESADPPASVRLDLKNTFASIRYTLRWEAAITQTFQAQPYMNVFLHDVFLEPVRTFGMMQEYLGVPQKTLGAMHEWPRGRSRRDFIENFDELREFCALLHPEYLQFFQDEPPLFL